MTAKAAPGPTADWFVSRAPAILYAHDGDTIAVPYVDLGIQHRHIPPPGASHVLIRFAGIAAREVKQGAKPADTGGDEARDNLAAMLGTARLWLRTARMDHYGNRIDAWVYREGVDDLTGPSVNDQLVAEGWALPWNGQGQQPKPAWPRVPGQGIGHQLAATAWKVPAAL